MNLSQVLNDGPAPPKRTSSQASTPDGTRFAGQQQHLLHSTNGLPAAGAFAPTRLEASHTPLYGPPSATPNSAQSGGLTPLKTPSQAHAGNQYPFPTQPVRPADAYPANSPASAKPVHNLQYPQMSPSHYGPGGAVPNLHAPSTSSLSPTPSSHPSQTPHSMRQSPLSTFSHPPGQAQPHPQQFHPSQPSTPLGPPPLMQRTSNPLDRTSPFHQRTLSGASNSLPMGSPAQHHLSIGNLVDSPGTHHRPSSQSARVNETYGGMERERSLSVSPKTKIPPRPSSISSRHSSQQDVHSARSSLQPVTGPALHSGSPTYGQPPTPPVPGMPHNHHVRGDMAPLPPHAAQAQLHTPSYPTYTGQALQRDTLSAIEHPTQRIGMSHLLQPSQPAENGASVGSPSVSQRASEQSVRPASAASESPASMIKTQPPDMPFKSQANEGPEQAKSLKRPASGEAAAEPPLKRGRTNRFRERPIWAQLHPQNQRAGQSGIQVKQELDAQHKLPPRPQQSVPRPAAAAAAVPRAQPSANGHQPPPHADANATGKPPWRQDPPIDGDLVHMRSILGPWEKSMKWHTPIPSMVAAVQDWLFQNLEACADIGNDPMQGAIEIEAKIGTLINQSDGQRCNLPVCSATVIHPAANRNYRFESQMNMIEHQKMNAYLNAITAATLEKGRVQIAYQHLRENDSFRTLSEAGIRTLPQTAHKRPINRELKLRTTTEDGTGKVKARIIKLPLADLHIYSPQDPYDCRISMNLEVNLNRDDIDPNALTVEPTPEKPAPPDRHKDRMSYRHLAYTVDLTRVDVRGLEPKFELELELDAKLVRDQVHQVKIGAPNAFSSIVEGFLDNCSILMRHRAQ